ncbi:hypothetical protein NL676_032741 [Syzygium grande]|nr:hypothetical protein NL676_032741 [Syzygium grande]
MEENRRDGELRLRSHRREDGGGEPPVVEGGETNRGGYVLILSATQSTIRWCASIFFFLWPLVAQTRPWPSPPDSTASDPGVVISHLKVETLFERKDFHDGESKVNVDGDDVKLVFDGGEAIMLGARQDPWQLEVVRLIDGSGGTVAKTGGGKAAKPPGGGFKV